MTDTGFTASMSFGCVHCGSSETRPDNHAFIYADLGGLGFYSILMSNCLTCGRQFEIVYRCHYDMTKIPMGDRAHVMQFDGHPRVAYTCALCSSRNTHDQGGYLRFDVTHLTGLYGLWICMDCGHVFELHCYCGYVITQARSRFVTDCCARSDILRSDRRCPICGNDEVRPQLRGLHTRSDGMLGTHVVCECPDCHIRVEDLYLCEFVETRAATDEEYDFEGRRWSDVEGYSCQNCFFRWTDVDGSRKHECPLCGSLASRIRE